MMGPSTSPKGQNTNEGEKRPLTYDACGHASDNLRPPTRLHGLKVPRISNRTTLLTKPSTHAHFRSEQ